MSYFDIHTHQLPLRPEDTAIINLSIGTGQDLSRPREVDTASGGIPALRSYGIHPWYIDDEDEQMEELRNLVSAPGVVAIGEAGLDKRAMTSLERQKNVFMRQVKLSEEVGKPLIIHCVKAWAELIVCRKEARPRQSWIIHGFRGNGALGAQLIRQGFLLSFGEYFQLSAACAAWPASLFAETDDKPVDIRVVYQKLSRALSVSEAELAARIESNIRAAGINP